MFSFFCIFCLSAFKKKWLYRFNLLFFFLKTPFESINQERIVELTKNKYVTISGVGRICSIKMTFPNGINLKMKVGKIDDCLKKRLTAINNLFIYSNRFANFI